MQDFQNLNQDQILKRLINDFAAFQQGKEGMKLLYPVELRKRAIAAVEAGIKSKVAASACKISVASIRSWINSTKSKPSCKRLKLEKLRESPSDFAIIYIVDQVRIQIPLSRLNSKLLKEIIDTRF